METSGRFMGLNIGAESWADTPPFPHEKKCLLCFRIIEAKLLFCKPLLDVERSLPRVVFIIPSFLILIVQYEKGMQKYLSSAFWGLREHTKHTVMHEKTVANLSCWLHSISKQVLCSSAQFFKSSPQSCCVFPHQLSHHLFSIDACANCIFNHILHSLHTTVVKNVLIGGELHFPSDDVPQIKELCKVEIWVKLCQGQNPVNAINRRYDGKLSIIWRCFFYYSVYTVEH